MAIMTHFSRSRIRKRSAFFSQRVKMNKNTVLSLLLVNYNIFLRSLLKEANNEARNRRSKLTKAEHVKSVAKAVLKKYR